MNSSNIISTIGQLANKAVFGIKKNSPTILVVTGIVGMVVTTVKACKATTKANEIIAKGKSEKEAADGLFAEEKNKKNPEYTETDYKNDISKVNGRTAIGVAKTYLPTVGIGVASIFCILASNHILRGRNAALAAAYVAVDKGFKNYRKRVVAKYGENVDKELKYGLKTEEIVSTTIDDDGNEQTDVKTVTTADLDEWSDYARYFDSPHCDAWTSDHEYNISFIKMQQAAANQVLMVKGYLFLNEVYRMLGIPESKAGQVVGWIYDNKNPTGDNYVRIIIDDLTEDEDYYSGQSIVVDFNVDGYIFDETSDRGLIS